MKRICNLFSSLWFFLWGHFFAFILYDKHFFSNRWFTNKHNGFGALGWKWTTLDACSRIFNRKNITSKYPICSTCTVLNPNNIIFDPEDLNNFHGFGNYYQALAKIYIGKGTYIAPNVGLITANHDVNNLDVHSEAKEINIGEKCWIGMNSIILPGVTLGNHTIVGAGSVVTKSFPEGYCVIVGNPAKKIRDLDFELQE